MLFFLQWMFASIIAEYCRSVHCRGSRLVDTDFIRMFCGGVECCVIFLIQWKVRKDVSVKRRKRSKTVRSSLFVPRFRCHVAESQQPQFERDSSGGFCISDWRFVDSVVLSTAPSEGKGASQGLHVGLTSFTCGALFESSLSFPVVVVSCKISRISHWSPARPAEGSLLFTSQNFSPSARQVQVFFCDFLCSKFRLCIALRFAHQSEMQRASEMIQALLKTTAATQRTPYHPLLFFVAASSEGGSGARLSLSGVVC